MTKQEILKIAAEVLEGKRPESDLKKYGTALGPKVEGEEAKKMLLQEVEEAEKTDAKKK